MKLTHLTQQAEQVYGEIESKFEKCRSRKNISIDSYIHNREQDSRRGLSLIIRPTKEVSRKIDQLRRQFLSILKGQYIYPLEDLHTTVLSVIPAVQSYSQFSEELTGYVRAVERAIKQNPQSFSVRFQGVVASDDSILVKGYPCDIKLQSLRNSILQELEAEGLGEKLKRRYVIVTAHLTFVRFTHQIHDYAKLDETLSCLTSTPAIEMLVENMSLVEHDWYLRSRNTNNVMKFNLL